MDSFRKKPKLHLSSCSALATAALRSLPTRLQSSSRRAASFASRTTPSEVEGVILRRRPHRRSLDVARETHRQGFAFAPLLFDRSALLWRADRVGRAAGHREICELINAEMDFAQRHETPPQFPAGFRTPATSSKCSSCRLDSWSRAELASLARLCSLWRPQTMISADVREDSCSRQQRLLAKKSRRML